MPKKFALAGQRGNTTLALGRENLLNAIETFLGPLILVIATCIVGFYDDGAITPSYLLLSIILFAVSFPGKKYISGKTWPACKDIYVSWFLLATILLAFSYASKTIYFYSQSAIYLWLILTPTLQFIAHILLRLMVPTILKWQGGLKNCIIVGFNEQGIALAQAIAATPLSCLNLHGFFDDRNTPRLESSVQCHILGKLVDVAQYAKINEVSHIYISLPMATQPRILALLESLRDTTSSVYFVPDLFITDLIQGRMDKVGNMPVVTICDSPFAGVDGLVKKLSDMALALIILILISPLLAGIALAIKMTSPGPVIFRQRRYGLDGKEIIVYKFRSMIVAEDGDKVTQATRNDSRITPLGSFLRRTSLDELPQFINVLQGRMSIVGPRPHAVAHNEQYRKLIRGYMLRHKVRPGITGLAQVNGFRGETETLDKMAARIEMDLEYLRNWSLRLDLQIIAKTISMVVSDKNAY